MQDTLFLALGEGLVVEQVIQEAEHVVVFAQSTKPASACPLCGTLSEAIHSRYHRYLADTPCAGRAVCLHLTVRRFSCHNTSCPRAIFTERLAGLAQPGAHMTSRLRDALKKLSFAISAEGTARLAPQLGMKGSASTVLRGQKATSLTEPPPFTKIGVDDFAFRRGRTYGTIIVDLESHHVIDILPDRSVATVSSWLAAHPTLELISRDRASDYATAAALGAPQATQVCDRWHLLRNLSEYVITFLARMRTDIRQASAEQAPSKEEDPLEEAQWQEREACEQAREMHRQERRVRQTVREQTMQTRLAERQDRYQQILTLHNQGLSSDEIAPRVGLSPRSIRQWLAEGVKTGPRRRRPSPLDAYASYLLQRWEEGEQRGETLYQELRTKGYTGSSRALYRYLKRWRPARMNVKPSAPVRHRPRKTAPAPGPFDDCQAKQAVWLYLRSAQSLTDEEQKHLSFLKQVHPSLEKAYRFVQEFVEMVHKREGDKLATWLQQVHHSEIPELIRFARGVERDRDPVQMALTLPYSNGVVEGHVHRLKLIKRQGYGRAAFPLFRKRVLYQTFCSP